MTIYKWKIYIISVKECQERRNYVEKLVERLNNFGLNTEIIDAYYWKSINVVDQLNKLQIAFQSDGTLSQSQLACFLSHMLVWEKIQKEYENGNDEIPIILEDDMDLHDFELFLNIEKDLYEIDYVNKYDGLILWKHPDKITNDTIQISNNLINCYQQWGTCAYSINKNLCNKMMQINNINMPLDNYLYGNIYNNYNLLMTINDPFINLGFIAGYGNTNTGYKFNSLIYG